jgi:CBS domain-containing protein
VRVADVMTPKPYVVTPDTRLNEVAYRMIQYECGAIPVVDNLESRRLLGIITDRDIVRRAVSTDRNPMTVNAEDVMTLNPHTLPPDASLEELYALFHRGKFRRVLIVDAEGSIVGIVSLTDLVRRVPRSERPAVQEVLVEVTAAGDAPPPTP